MKVEEQCNYLADTAVDPTATETPWNLLAIKNSFWKTWCLKKNNSTTKNATCFVNNNSVSNTFVRSNTATTFETTKNSNISITKNSTWSKHPSTDNNNKFRETNLINLRFKNFKNTVRVNRCKCNKCKKNYLRLGVCLRWHSNSNRLKMANSSTLISSIISLNVTIQDKFLKVKNSFQTKIKMKFKELKTQLM